MDGGPSKVFAMLCGMGPPGDNLLMGPPGGKVYNLQFIINSLLFRVNSLQLISREFDDKLQISFDFLGGFVEKA